MVGLVWSVRITPPGSGIAKEEEEIRKLKQINTRWERDVI